MNTLVLTGSMANDATYTKTFEFTHDLISNVPLSDRHKTLRLTSSFGFDYISGSWTSVGTLLISTNIYPSYSTDYTSSTTYTLMGTCRPDKCLNSTTLSNGESYNWNYTKEESIKHTITYNDLPSKIVVEIANKNRTLAFLQTLSWKLILFFEEI